jgi:hypothetical protein
VEEAVDWRQWRRQWTGASRQEAACTEVRVVNSAFDFDLDVAALPIVSTKSSSDIALEIL